LIPAFVHALCSEITYVARQQARQPVWSIFFGGGTPSLLTSEQFAQILDTIRAGYDLQADAEITFEANPADLAAGGRAYLTALRALGINRISIGMQSAHASELTLFNRRHSNDDVAAAVRTARAAGFDNLNLDLIYGIPHQTLAMWESTLGQAVALQPEHFSLYALGIEDGTPMQAWVEGGRLPAPDDDLTADMYDAATAVLGAAGYDQYEISNWAKPGRACRHNLQYWRNWDYLGFGPGAHGFAGGVRYAVMLSPQKYIRALEQGAAGLTYPRTPAVETATVLAPRDEIAETLIMSLRLLHEGVLLSDFRTRFGVDLRDLHGGTLQRYIDGGLLTEDAERLTLTARGRLLSNMIFRDLV
jgi:oxygen-independent coproporphyrinogen-3 oxidase